MLILSNVIIKTIGRWLDNCLKAIAIKKFRIEIVCVAVYDFCVGNLNVCIRRRCFCLYSNHNQEIKIKYLLFTSSQCVSKKDKEQKENKNHSAVQVKSTDRRRS